LDLKLICKYTFLTIMFA